MLSMYFKCMHLWYLFVCSYTKSIFDAGLDCPAWLCLAAVSCILSCPHCSSWRHLHCAQDEGQRIRGRAWWTVLSDWALQWVMCSDGGRSLGAVQWSHAEDAATDARPRSEGTVVDLCIATSNIDAVCEKLYWSVGCSAQSIASEGSLPSVTAGYAVYLTIDIWWSGFDKPLVPSILCLFQGK